MSTKSGGIVGGLADRRTTPTSGVRQFGWRILALFCLLDVSTSGAELTDDRLFVIPAACAKMKLLIKRGEHLLVPAQAELCLVAREQSDGPNSKAVADVLHELFWVLNDIGELGKAEDAIHRELAIRESVEGPEHPDVADALIAQVEVLQQRGTYGPISALLDRAYHIQTRALGERHPRLVRTLLHKSHDGLRRLEIDAAERYLLLARAILEAAADTQSKGYTDILVALAELHWHFGNQSRSLPLYEQAAKLLREQFGNKHPYYASVLFLHSQVQNHQGNYEQALSWLKLALEIVEKTLGGKTRMAAAVMLSMASSYRGLNDLTAAETVARQALASYEQLYGHQHRKTAQALNRLGILQHERRELAIAEALHVRALAIREKVEAPDDPDIADSLHNLAEVHMDRGEFTHAERLFLRSLGIRERTLGAQSEPVAQSLFSLGRLYGKQRSVAQALPLLERSFAITEAQLRLMSVTLTEARLTRFLETLRGQEDFIYSLACAEPAFPALSRLALQVAFLRKGRSVDWAAEHSFLTSHLTDEDDRNQVERLKALRSRYATLVLADTPQQDSGERREILGGIQAEATAIESRLAERIAPLRFKLQLPGPLSIISRVAERMPKDSALIEIVEFNRTELGPPNRGPAGRHYLALLLAPDQAVRLVDLGPAAGLEAEVTALHAALETPYSDPQEASRRLFSHLIKPIVAELGGRQDSLFISPDGALHLVPFAVLGDAQPLLERVRISYVSSGRDLLRKSSPAPSTEPAIFADPKFADAATSPSQFNSPSRASERALMLRLLGTLPGTRLEAEQVALLLPRARVFLGAQAQESALISLRAPVALHIATHGLFLSEQGSDADRPQRGFSVRRMPLENPLLRSALVLAPDSAVKAPMRTESTDGLATALEIAGMNLWGTRLVVLSACNSGRGVIRSGQGVYGLRRAFIAAGAETLVVSQWKVDDEATKELMIGFYRHLSAGSTASEALHAAAQHVRTMRPHPYYWAGFVVIGDGFQPGTRF